MTRRRDPALQGLLELGKVIRRQPDNVRARVLSRARASIVAEPWAAPDPPAAGIAAQSYKLRLALAATFALAVCGAAAVAALSARAPARLEPAPRFSPPEIPPPRAAATDLPRASFDVPTPPASIAKARRPARRVNPQESYAAELDLLKRAQAAHARRDFLGALALITEHARRFPTGRLAEEREALRVRSLAGTGRADEARRAVAVFAERFPRSVLLPRLAEAVRATE